MLFRAIQVTSFLFFFIPDGISVIGSLICSTNKYSFSANQIHKINFLYFSGKKQCNSFLSAWTFWGGIFFFNIQGLTRNDKTNSNKKCTKLENIGDLGCKIVERLKLEVQELWNYSFKLSISKRIKPSVVEKRLK